MRLIHQFDIDDTYLETTAVRILAVEPVYSLTILSKYLSIDATTTPPKEVNKTAIISKTKIFSSKPGKKIIASMDREISYFLQWNTDKKSFELYVCMTYVMYLPWTSFIKDCAA